ncbi:MAG: hypothetical protein ACRDTG_02980 [Pseudonocardiaceae bacterium]
MSILNSNGQRQHSESAGTRPVVLVRYRPDVTRETARTVHLVPLPAGDEMGTVSALCRIVLRPEEIENVTPGEGMPCTRCLVSHVGGSDPPVPDTAPVPEDGISDDAGPLAAGVTYRDWG